MKTRGGNRPLMSHDSLIFWFGKTQFGKVLRDETDLITNPVFEGCCLYLYLHYIYFFRVRPYARFCVTFLILESGFFKLACMPNSFYCTTSKSPLMYNDVIRFQ